jgi:hypothetical protein
MLQGLFAVIFGSYNTYLNLIFWHIYWLIELPFSDAPDVEWNTKEQVVICSQMITLYALI